MVQESVEQVRARVDAENAARHAASSSTGKRRKRKKRRKKRLPRTPRLRQGRQRPCDHQRHVLAVRGAPVPVHRQSGGHSCSMSMDLADPVSSGKYSGAFVFTATVAEPTVMSFTVPLNGYSIVATATVVTSCLRRDVVWWWLFLSWWCFRFCLGQCEADDWKIFLQLFPVPRVRWVCMHAELLVQQQ